MAITYTYTALSNTIWGNKRMVAMNCSASGTYTTGGDSFTAAAAFGLDVIEFIMVAIDGSTESSFATPAIPAPDLTNFKWVLYTQGSSSGGQLAELASATSMTGFKFNAMAVGY